jgi:hypothetical protein
MDNQNPMSNFTQEQILATLLDHLTRGDMFLHLVTQAGGFVARKQYQEWLEIAINLTMQDQVLYTAQLFRMQDYMDSLAQQLKQQDQKGEQLNEQSKGQTTPEGAPESKAADSSGGSKQGESTTAAERIAAVTAAVKSKTTSEKGAK